MIKSKYISVITTVLIIFALILTFGFCYCASNDMIEDNTSNPAYLTKLFDDSVVHTIDIQMSESDWQNLLDNAIAEEYTICDVVIDGEKVSNVGIRAKGNTSLSQIVNSDSDRYSFKIEFDHYSRGNLYYGLDKLALNNLMADASYMKDYITYDMMNYIGANAPYSAFMEITVNGEPWGLYLGVECIDESFLTRCYGNNYGELYKPDSMEFGDGGKGGQGRVDLDELDFMKPREDGEQTDKNNSEKFPMNGEFNFENMPNMGNMPNMENIPNMPTDGDFDFSNMPDMPNMGQRPNSEANTDNTQNPNGNRGQRPTNGNTDKPVSEGDSNVNRPNMGDMPEGFDFSNMPNMGEMPENMPEGMDFSNMFGGGKGGFGSMFGRGGADLKYTDDNLDSYSTLLNSSKTNSTIADKTRLINSLKVLSTGENLDTVMDIENTLKYWVVHNFVVNGDSYTGSMLHNYYLYEENGVMTMLPWDYNLAFGGFAMGGKWQGDTGLDSATTLINSPIDSPLSSGSEDDRPFWGKLIQDEEYKELYHQYYEEFLNSYFESGYFEQKMFKLYSLLYSYVENDVSAFYTADEFIEGFNTLKEVCLLRSESILKQLNGEISITSYDSENYIDGSHLNLDALGDMGMNGGPGGFGGRGDNKDFDFNKIRETNFEFDETQKERKNRGN